MINKSYEFVRKPIMKKKQQTNKVAVALHLNTLGISIKSSPFFRHTDGSVAHSSRKKNASLKQLMVSMKKGKTRKLEGCLPGANVLSRE